MSHVLLISILVYVASGAIDYLSNCNRHTPTCLSYNDGCNDCRCDINTGFQACTEKFCFVEGTPVCKECEAGYWLSFHKFQPPGYPTCDSRFIMAPTALEDNSKCACPASYPYYVPGVGCVNENYCTADIKLRRDVFTFRAPPQIGRCPYEYQLCTSNLDCDTGLICNIPKSNYETCIPLAARFDNNCNLITNCPQCIPDCMGTGYGYCIPDPSTMNTPAPITTIPRPAPINVCETGGCSSQICAYGASQMISTCEYRCEYGCLRYQTCRVDPLNGECGWQTNIGQESQYLNCINSCNGLVLPPGRIPPAPFSFTLMPKPTPNTNTLCETGGCSSQICAYGASTMISTCEFRCEYGCLRYQTCGIDPLNGGCGWKTNIGQELEYEQCMNSCTGWLIPPQLPPSISISPVLDPPTLPSICAVTLCLNPCDTGLIGSGTGECNGCSAPSVVCSVESCTSSPCCGCAKYSIGNRDVTTQCAGSAVACRCAQGDTYCCDGNQYSSACEATCGTCYDLALDCTLGPCV